MVTRDQITAVVFQTIDEFNESEGTNLEKANGQALFGKDGALDSLLVVNLIVMVEQDIEDELDITITLANERAMSQKRSPFGSVEALVDYIGVLVEEELRDA